MQKETEQKIIILLERIAISMDKIADKMSNVSVGAINTESFINIPPENITGQEEVLRTKDGKIIPVFKRGIVY